MDRANLVERLSKDFPKLRFRQGRKFAFRPPRTIFFEPATEAEAEYKIYSMRLLHEVGHAISGHRDYTQDLKRVKMECEAWQRARELSEKYGVEYDEEIAEGELESYREWLHQKSKCPKCGLTRYQAGNGEYHCPFCEA